MATYPAAVKSFTTKQDNIDVVAAGDVNQAYDEITALQNALGVTPATSAGSMAGGWDATTGKDWTTVKSRLDNIEKGVVGDSHASIYVHQAGGDTIQPSGAVVPLTLRSSASSPKILQLQDSSGTNKVTVDNNGAAVFTGQVTAPTALIQNVLVADIFNANTKVMTAGNALPFKMACGLTNITVNSGQTSGTGSVGLTSGFTLMPVVVTQIFSGAGSAIQATTLVYNVSTSGFTLGVYTHSALASTSSFPVFWIAVQGSSNTTSL